MGTINLDDNLYVIWMENAEGHRWVPCLTGYDGPPGHARPEDHVYHHAQFPTQVNEDILLTVTESAVAACAHDGEMKADHGIIDGMKGRYCRGCGGYQSCGADEPWPDEWKAGHSHRLATGSSGYPENLVLAMTRPTQEERFLACERVNAEGYESVVPRGGQPLLPKAYPLDKAILIAARACEGCMNVLLWEYGCQDGYPAGSEEHKRVGTSCLFCTPVPTIREAEEVP